MLTLTLNPTPGSAAIINLTLRRCTGLRITTGPHGFESLSCTVPLSAAEAMRLYQRGALHVSLCADGLVVWEGRLEDRRLVAGGLAITAFGYWRIFGDIPYTALWSDTRIDRWRAAINADPGQAGSVGEERYQIDTSGRLFLAPQKDADYTLINQGRVLWQTPDQSLRQVTSVSFDYALRMPVGWRAQLYGYTRAGALVGTYWTLDGNGATQTGSVASSVTACDMLVFALLWNGGGTVTYAGETGDAYLEITDLRIKSTTAATVTMRAIAVDIIARASAAMPAVQMASLIDDPGLDIEDALYEDVAMGSVLETLAGYGSGGNPYSVAVWEGPLLHIRERDSLEARSWYVDATDLEVERTLDTYYNSAYTIYQNDAGATVRTADTTDDIATEREGVLRRQALSVDTTSASFATSARNLYVRENAQSQPRIRVQFRKVMALGGGVMPLYRVRAGDTLTIRNLPATVPDTLERLRTFRLGNTDYDGDTDTLSVEPLIPPPILEALLAQVAAGIATPQLG